MEKRKNKRKLDRGQHLEFNTPFSLEETRERFYTLANQRLVLGNSQIYIRGYDGILHVDDSVIDADTIEFRVWITPLPFGTEIVGFMKRQTLSETFVVSRLHTSIFNYLPQLVFLLFTILILTRMPLPHSFIFLAFAWLCFWVWFGWRLSKRYLNKFACVFEDTLTGNIRTNRKTVVVKRKHV